MKHPQRGSVAVELVVLLPGLMLVLGLMVAGGRIWLARSVTADAAYAAARAGALARTPAQAQTDGAAQGVSALDGGRLRCASRSIVLDTGGFARPVGTPATVRADVTCVVALADLLVPGLPGSMTIRADGAAALDTYRER